MAQERALQKGKAKESSELGKAASFWFDVLSVVMGSLSSGAAGEAEDAGDLERLPGQRHLVPVQEELIRLRSQLQHREAIPSAAAFSQDASEVDSMATAKQTGHSQCLAEEHSNHQCTG